MKIFSQDLSINGQVIDKSGMAIPWVNIGVRNKDLGTVSDKNGNFKLSIPESYVKDSLTFSCVGYKEQSVPIRSIAGISYLSISLEEKLVNLAEVKVSSRKVTVRKLGISGYTPMIWTPLNTYDRNDIIEQGRLIEIERPSILLTANVNTGGIKHFKDSLTFRLNIYKVEDNKPGERLIEKSIIKSFDPAQEIISFDLRKDYILLEEDCVIAFELLPKSMVSYPRMRFRAKMGSDGGFARNNSLGNWQQIKGASSVIFITVKQ